MHVSTLYSNRDLLNKYQKEIPKTWYDLISTSKYIFEEEKKYNNTIVPNNNEKKKKKKKRNNNNKSNNLILYNILYIIYMYYV